MDGVANIVGGNAGNVIRDKHLEELFNIDKYAGQETTTPSYRKWQKIRNGYDGILRLFNSDTYKDFFNNKKEEKNGSDKNEK